MKVRYTIEGWTHQEYTDVIEIDDDEVEGLTEPELEKFLEEAVSDCVNNVVSWGFEVIE